LDQSPESSQETFTQKVNMKVKPSKLEGKTVTRYTATQLAPIITSEHLDNCIEFQNRLRQIITVVLGDEDRELVSQLTDASKNIIVSVSQLREILAFALSSTSEDFSVEYGNIMVNVPEVERGCWCSKKKYAIQPVDSIKLQLDGKIQDIRYTQRELFDTLASEYRISTSKVLVI
jgi:hypothetical protein